NTCAFALSFDSHTASAADCWPARAFTRYTFGEHLSPVMESANETVVAISLPARSATWPTANVEPEFTVPVRKSTLPTWKSLSAFCTDTDGLASSSSKVNSTWRPMMPPAALTSLVASSSPHFTCSGIGTAQRRYHANLDRIGGIGTANCGRRQQRRYHRRPIVCHVILPLDWLAAAEGPPSF